MLRIGNGYDIHRIVPGRRMVLGGVAFPVDYGLDGHSDADCLTHAICDALLGAAGLCDIGHFFPNTDPSLKDIDSQMLLQRVQRELRQRGWRIVNVDSCIIAERPKIQNHITAMKAALAASMGIEAGAVGVKATTNEGVGDLGKGIAVAAHAVALIESI